MTTIFFTSVFFLFYTFIGYPLLLRIVKNEETMPVASHSELPELTVVLCIYNSRNELTKRIENIFESDYPSDKVKILVVSDGSTDNPSEVIELLNDSRIQLLHYSQNRGKSFALSHAKQHVKTEMVAFADIRQSFDNQALKHLAFVLADKNIGAVSGNLKIRSLGGTSEQGLYWKYEKSIRIKESELHSVLGVTGAIYMARSSLIPDVPEDSLLDDMYIPLSIVKQGYKVKFCESAVAYDTGSNTVTEEFYRKVRTLAGNYQLIKQLPWLLSIKSNPLFFQFISHKVARLIMPFALISLFISSSFLALTAIDVLFWSQIFFYSYTFIGYKYNQSQLPFINTCISFCSLNLAALVAAWKYFTVKDITSLWKKH